MNGWIATIKLSHVGPASYKDFYSSLSSIITRDEYEQFLHLFKKNDCTTMGHWLRVYNVANVVPFIFETFRRMTGQCYPDKVDVCKGAVSIPGTSMTRAEQVLGKNKKPKLYSPGGICHLCRDKREELQHCSCNGALKCGGYCEECQLDM